MERVLKQHGYRVANMTGGFTTYQIATEQQGNLDTWTMPDGGAPVTLPAQAVEQRGGNGQGPAGQVVGLPPMGSQVAVVELNACGLQCPGPIMAVYKKMQEMEPGQELRVLATDPGFKRDVAAWAERTGNTLLDVGQADGRISATLRKGSAQPQVTVQEGGVLPNAKTMVVFSGDLDHAIASFIIANGAAAMGKQVSMFFTFWGLNILRRPDPKPVKKNLVEKMFGRMLPKGADALKLSRLNMGGAGTAMMKAVMKSKNIDSLTTLMHMAQENGVRMIACQMSMDMMGIKPEELIDGVEIGGVATFIGETDKANATLFI